MVKTCEKYNKALERAQKMQENSNGMILKKWLWGVFPEVKESEDERIKKTIIRILKGEIGYTSKEDIDKYVTWLEKQGEKKNTRKREIDDAYLQGICDAKHEIEKQGKTFNTDITNRDNEMLHAISVGLTDIGEDSGWGDFGGIPIVEIQEWLEKQGEKVTNINGEDYGIDGLYHAINILEKTVGRVEGYQSDDGILSHKVAINAVKELYKKQGEQEPTDKVEPKFKVGNWIVFNGSILHIDEVVNGYYRTTSIGDGIHNSYDWDIDNAARLWTIQEAKDGDVLVYETDEVEWIFIYREIVPAASEVPHDLLRYYFLLEGNYFNWNGVSAMITDDYKLYLKPATKEQRDVLFSKMKEAGYEWDSEKKELKKIEVKTLNADKVIAWLNENVADFWANPCNPQNVINQFKKDFGLC
jgi:hypothetical protein